MVKDSSPVDEKLDHVEQSDLVVIEVLNPFFDVLTKWKYLSGNFQYYNTEQQPGVILRKTQVMFCFSC